MGTNIFTAYSKSDDIYVDILKDVKKRFDASNYGLERLWPKEKIKKVVKLMKDELEGKTMTEFAWWTAKTYNYLIVDGYEIKKTKGLKKCVLKRET